MCERDDFGSEGVVMQSRGIDLRSVRGVRLGPSETADVLVYRDGRWVNAKVAGDSIAGGSITSEHLAPGSVTDQAIGTVTVDDTRVPADDQGTFRELFSELANRIKTAVGKASWRDTPSITLEELKAHASRHLPNGADPIPLATATSPGLAPAGITDATPNAVPDKLVKRDATASAQFQQVRLLGSPPLIVDSTAQVNNLNASYLQGYSWPSPIAASLSYDTSLYRISESAAQNYSLYINSMSFLCSLTITRTGTWLLYMIADFDIEDPTGSMVWAVAMLQPAPGGDYQKAPNAILATRGYTGTPTTRVRGTVLQVVTMQLNQNDVVTMRGVAVSNSSSITAIAKRYHTRLVGVWVAP